jgi:molybdopterin/thiamine biosynthesis adenylyltransferase
VSQTGKVHRFIVVGAGGIGGWLIPGLVRILEWKFPGSALVIVDGDSYEPKNKERQDFKDIGPKASIQAMKLTEDFTNTVIIPVTKWVVADDFEGNSDENSSKIKVSQLIAENDAVFAVVDNFSTRKIIFDAASKLENVDVFTGGNDEEYFGSIYHYQRRNGIDVTQHPVIMHPEYENPPDRNPGELSCQERAQLEGGTQILATNMAVASFLLARVQKTIVNEENPTEGEIYFDLGVGKAESYDRSAEQSTVSIQQ